MQAIVYLKEREEFIVDTVPIPVPRCGEVRVKVKACALNPVDAKVGSWIPLDRERIINGLDVCGTVDAVGPDVTSLSVGDLVLYHGRMFEGQGGFADYAIHDSVSLVNLSHLSTSSVPMNPELIIQLAGSPCAAWTAYKALVDCLGICVLPNHPSNSEASIAIYGASGGVGSFLLQFAKLAGFKTIIAICSSKNAEFVTSLGATHVIDYKTEDVSLSLRKASVSLDYAIDCVGSETARTFVKHMSYGGKILPLVSFANFGDLHCFLQSISICQLSLGGSHDGGMKARLRLAEVGKVVTEMILNKEVIGMRALTYLNLYFSFLEDVFHDAFF
jgi:NADPH2:quinone reductase